MKKNKTIFFVVVLAFILIVYIYYRLNILTYFPLFEKIPQLIPKISCEIKGNKWIYCNSHQPCGCMTVYKDGGKQCISGKDCTSNQCTVNSKDLPNKDGFYVGKCPHDSDFGCGEAIIENGKISRDERNCVY